MIPNGKVCRDWLPLIRSMCKSDFSKDHEWKAELYSVIYAEFEGEWCVWRRPHVSAVIKKMSE